MSRQNPKSLKISKVYEVIPLDIFESIVVPSGNGAVIRAYKRFIGKNVIVIIKD